MRSDDKVGRSADEYLPSVAELAESFENQHKTSEVLATSATEGKFSSAGRLTTKWRRARQIVDGFLCVDKPAGWTSRDVVNRIQRAVKPTKVGHAGTLDPLATGVLVVAVGRATKLVSYVQRLEKRYLANFELGKTSDTEDVTGQITRHDISDPPREQQVAMAFQRYVGRIMQRPPAYSALRVKGRRAYDLAREGRRVDLKERPIVVHSIHLLDYAFPNLRLDIRCGSGTYVRSLGRDIGEDLGCGAVMSELRRTDIGSFSVDTAKSINQLIDIDAIRQQLQPLISGVEVLPQLKVDEGQLTRISHGQKLDIAYEAKEAAAVSADGELAAVLARSEAGVYRSVVNFVGK